MKEYRVKLEPFETGKAGYHGSMVIDTQDESVICEMYERETSLLNEVDVEFFKYVPNKPEIIAVCEKEGLIVFNSESDEYKTLIWFGFEELKNVIKFNNLLKGVQE